MFCTICNEMIWNQLNFFFNGHMIWSVRLSGFFFSETKLKVKIQKKRGFINRYDDPTSWEFNREKMIIFSITIATMRLKSETMPKPTFANQHHLKWVTVHLCHRTIQDFLLIGRKVMIMNRIFYMFQGHSLNLASRDLNSLRSGIKIFCPL